MKEKTQKTLIIGAAGVAVAAFLLLPREEPVAGLGGGGGAPILPILPEETAEAVGDVVYNIVTPEAVMPEWFVGAPAPDDMKKAAVVMEKYERVYAPAQAALETSLRVGAPTAADVAAYGAAKKAAMPKPEDLTISERAGGVARGGIIEAGKLAVIGTGGGIDFISSIFGLRPGAEATAREGVRDVFAPKKGITTTPAKTEAAHRAYARKQVSEMMKTQPSYRNSGRAGREYGGGVTGMGARAYSGARATALSSLKKSRRRAGAPD